MRNKKARKGKAARKQQTKRKASKKQVARGLFPPRLAVLTKIIIKKNGQIDIPGKLISFQKGVLVWLIHNKSTDPHTMSIDPASFKINGVPENPLQEDVLLPVVVSPGGFDVIVGRLKPAARIAAYHYEINALDMVRNTRVTIDPDLDVVDPRP